MARRVGSPNSLFFISLPLVIIAAAVMAACQPDLRYAVPLLAGVSGVMAAMTAVAVYLGERGSVRWSPWLILAVALLLRLLFVTAPPQLSDDIYRYLWDGGHLLRGIDPYAAAPAVAPPVSGELARIRPLINHPQYVTIYPPAAQLVFASGAATGAGTTGMKSVFVLLDLALCGLIIVLLKRLGLPSFYSVLYAWNPLPMLEIAGSGHVDGAGMFFFMAACCFLVQESRPRQSSASGLPRTMPYLLAGGCLAAAVLVKLFPLVLFPALFLLVPAGRRRYFVIAFLATTAALLAPFVPHLDNLAATLDLYARHWEFAGFAFRALRGLTGSGETARFLLAGTFMAYLLIRYVSLLRNLKLKGSAAVACPADDGRLVLGACRDIALAFLLLTPTLQPWYALTLAVLLPFAAGPAGLVLCWAVLLSYQVQIPYAILGEWIEDDAVTALIFFAPVAAWGLGRLLRRRKAMSASCRGGPAWPP